MPASTPELTQAVSTTEAAVVSGLPGIDSRTLSTEPIRARKRHIPRRPPDPPRGGRQRWREFVTRSQGPAISEHRHRNLRRWPPPGPANPGKRRRWGADMCAARVRVVVAVLVTGFLGSGLSVSMQDSALANVVTPAARSASPAPTPTATATATPASPAPAPTPTPTATATPASPAPTPTPTATATPASPAPTPTPTATATPASPAPTPTPTATATPASPAPLPLPLPPRPRPRPAPPPLPLPPRPGPRPARAPRRRRGRIRRRHRRRARLLLRQSRRGPRPRRWSRSRRRPRSAMPFRFPRAWWRRTPGLSVRAAPARAGRGLPGRSRSPSRREPP